MIHKLAEEAKDGAPKRFTTYDSLFTNQIGFDRSAFAASPLFEAGSAIKFRIA
ncbi:MAG: hypothetical protein QOJ64_3915 [Acidobacteriota bacterium]|nr:hypothetical protein [Acidobacteriota bacterium]